MLGHEINRIALQVPTSCRVPLSGTLIKSFNIVKHLNAEQQAGRNGSNDLRGGNDKIDQAGSWPDDGINPVQMAPLVDTCAARSSGSRDITGTYPADAVVVAPAAPGAGSVRLRRCAGASQR
ncbi:hypothetical protein PBV52_50815 [Streptomyces sp. T12]|uniref:hypothetical protein n=1 Tax=Streptomyces sp. T12 TaxID=477697 RepID=UPI002365D845|nr:hypothetical protein [Streptomyces sp. T12]WDF44486.1 hypothetical protein PBV52_50815 [Streptomyces sp. T12]